MKYSEDLKILLVAHGHPQLSRGGAEIAAENLNKYYTDQGIETALLGRVDGGVLPVEIKNEPPIFSASDGYNSIYRFGDDYLLESYIDDWFAMQNRSPAALRETLAAFLLEIQPNIIHIHHYAHIGLEILQIFKETLPSCKVIFTIHEYMAICLRDGQMVTNPNNELCYEAEKHACSSCFPQYSPEAFEFRKKKFLLAFENVDQFTSPSHFLKQRYVEWGIEEGKIAVIENVHKAPQLLPARPLDSNDLRNQFAYFGQATPFKGLDLLLDAFAMISEDDIPGAHLHLFAGNIHWHANEFQERIFAKIESLGSRVTMHGGYSPEDLPRLMADIDWVVIPSIWWENSPMVIQETIRFGRPLIASDLGGVGEKVHDAVGLRFQGRSSESLKGTLVEGACNQVWTVKTNSLKEASHCSGEDYINLLMSLIEEKKPI